MKRKFLKITLALLLLFCLNATANNLHISNASLVGINTINHYIMVKFDISWENSWRTSTTAPYNWDAAWIFIKYRVNGGEWLHAALSATDADHVAPTGSSIDAGSDGKGVFMYRAFDGTGTNTWTNVHLRWNYGVNGLADDATNVEARVIGIEMVYVPQGAFYVGDNASSLSVLKQGSSDNDPWYINSENEINVTNSPGSGTGIGTTNAEYYYTTGSSSGEDATGATFNIPATFPKGYKPFYCMKYEISQGQYTEFLNMLTRTQQSSRVWSTITTDEIFYIYVMSNTETIMYRNTITCPASGNGTLNPIIFSTATPEIACNYMSWADGIAYADWAGLRPMTELEFEKACRGNLPAVTGEYAWGNTTVTSDDYELSNSGTASESISANYSTISGNSAYAPAIGTINSPLRVGIFASNLSNSNRVTSGAGYYGIMELSGNLYERTVTIGNSTGRNFTGLNGNGILTSAGNSDVTNWSNSNSIGSGLRGGNWLSSISTIRTSNRAYAAFAFPSRGSALSGGFRGVRCP
jgi:formylglycine-generating enzyme required for sulfatase activity